MKNKLIVLLGVLLYWSCGTQNTMEDPDAIVREASGTPMSFHAIFEEVEGESPCQSRLVDPEDDTELILVSFLDGFGDYQAPLGKYGLSADELLRIDCRSGEVVGVVRK